MAEATRPRCSCWGVERPARCCCLICPNHILFLHLAYYPHGHLWRPPRNAWMRTVRECVCPMPPIASSLRSNGHRLCGLLFVFFVVLLFWFFVFVGFFFFV